MAQQHSGRPGADQRTTCARTALATAVALGGAHVVGCHRGGRLRQRRLAQPLEIAGLHRQRRRRFGHRLSKPIAKSRPRHEHAGRDPTSGASPAPFPAVMREDG